MICATAAFMVATVVAMVVSKWKLGHISPMLWISGALVLVFGGLTMYFHDPRFIQMKPTIVYAMFAGDARLRAVDRAAAAAELLDTAYPGLTPRAGAS